MLVVLRLSTWVGVFLMSLELEQPAVLSEYHVNVVTNRHSHVPNNQTISQSINQTTTKANIPFQSTHPPSHPPTHPPTRPTNQHSRTHQPSPAPRTQLVSVVACPGLDCDSHISSSAWPAHSMCSVRQVLRNAPVCSCMRMHVSTKRQANVRCLYKYAESIWCIWIYIHTYIYIHGHI